MRKPPCQDLFRLISAYLLVRSADHTWMYNVPCFQTVVTCGRPCGKPMPKCSHNCRRACHAGPCLPMPANESTSGSVEKECTQPCDFPRSDCGHPCGRPCHEAANLTCAQVLGKWRCRVVIPLVCSCGHRKEDQACYQVNKLIEATL